MEMYMRIAAAALLLGSLCLAACDNSNDVIIVPVARTGTFVLQTINGHSLPATAFDSISPPLRIDVLSGAITITTTNAFTDVVAFQQTLGGVLTTRTVSCSGTYTFAGNIFTFVETTVAPDCGRTFTGVLTGTTLSAPLFGTTAVYIK
jgi:hypothetical protein